MAAASVVTLSMLSLLDTLDPYWKSQLLVGYPKGIHTCMDFVELEQQYGYKGVLNQPSLPPLGMESRSMHHSIDGRKFFGGEHALNTCTLYSDFMHSYTIFL